MGMLRVVAGGRGACLLWEGYRHGMVAAVKNGICWRRKEGMARHVQCGGKKQQQAYRLLVWWWQAEAGQGT